MIKYELPNSFQISVKNTRNFTASQSMLNPSAFLPLFRINKNVFSSVNVFNRLNGCQADELRLKIILF